MVKRKIERQSRETREGGWGGARGPLNSHYPVIHGPALVGAAFSPLSRYNIVYTKHWGGRADQRNENQLIWSQQWEAQDATKRKTDVRLVGQA
jgi:hypothetical protein